MLIGGHLALGIARPIMAADPSGMRLAGLPVRPVQQKENLDLDFANGRSEFRTCREIALDIKEPIMQFLAQLVLTDMRASWSTRATEPFAYLATPPYREDRWPLADCLATTDSGTRPTGTKALRLNTDLALLDYLAGRRPDLELSSQSNSGLTMRGFYLLERTNWAAALVLDRCLDRDTKCSERAGEDLELQPVADAACCGRAPADCGQWQCEVRRCGAGRPRRPAARRICHIDEARHRVSCRTADAFSRRSARTRRRLERTGHQALARGQPLDLQRQILCPRHY